MLRGLLKRVGNILTGRKVDEGFFDEVEEALILADISVATAEDLLKDLRNTAHERALVNSDDLKDALRASVASRLGQPPPLSPLPDGGLAVWLIVGVNGTGKTTTVGKLAHWAKREGARPLLAAADTFRAAAVDQVRKWGDRAGVPVVAHQPGADPAAVTFDALQAGRSRGCNLIIVDTAGRLHTKLNLMEELRKIERVIVRETGAPAAESFLVLDATTGQNGLAQASAFAQSVSLTGIVLTKLDGTAKGGIVISIRDRMSLPIAFVGTGEGLEDIERFDTNAFVSSMLE